MVEKEELKEEKSYLSKTIKRLNELVEITSKKKQNEKKEFDDLVEYLSSNYSGLDDEERANCNNELNQICMRMNNVSALLSRYEKQKLSPYFGKIVFQADDENRENNYYIGINNVIDDVTNFPMVFDWRAPISSMYYEYELGRAKYLAPMGEIEGNISQKRQFKIVDKNMEFCIDSSITINDDILIEALNGKTSEKMKNIVATIQKEQNEIIRKDINKNYIVQGVAGSGKTSVALHRIAYLLYNNRAKLSSNDIVILSPNGVFSSYISNVLPELGENNMEQLTISEIAKEELVPFLGKIQSREDYLDDLIINDKEFLEEINIKGSYKFLLDLKQYLKDLFEADFIPQDIKFDKKIISADTLSYLYKERYKTKTPAVRIDWITDYIIDELNITVNIEAVASRIKRVLYPMFRTMNMEDIYHEFLHTQGLHYERNEDGSIRYDDIAPLLYIKNYLLGIRQRSEIKYLVIDEMQDYTMTTIEIINSIFPCNKILLGDINQCVDRNLEQDYLENLCKLIDNSELILMKKCYRSTRQITEFSNRFTENNIDSFMRNGQEVEVIDATSKLEKIAYLEKEINDSKDYNHIAILTKNTIKAEELYNDLKNDFNDISLVQEGVQEQTKISIMPVMMSKGLEFDKVIIYDFNINKIKNNINKKLLYVACTRALHELKIIY